jgi:hypothetical protein
MELIAPMVMSAPHAIDVVVSAADVEVSPAVVVGPTVVVAPALAVVVVVVVPPQADTNTTEMTANARSTNTRIPRDFFILTSRPLLSFVDLSFVDRL